MSKKPSKNLFVVFLVLFLSSCDAAEVREPSVAGAFYPKEEKILSNMMNDFLSNTQTRPKEGRLLALVSPHAGYYFSGQVAAYGYKNLQGKDIKTVILIGPSHRHGFQGASVYAKGSFKSPLGIVKIDEKLASTLINEKAHVAFKKEVFEGEHSVEVQIPFLQAVLKDFRIVPVLIGSPTRESFSHLLERLSDVLSNDEKALIIASTDLSHYHDYGAALKMDRTALKCMEAVSLIGLEEALSKGQCELCGMYPVMLALQVAKKLGANEGVLYKYANSGDVTGDKRAVVGYASLGLWKSPLTSKEKEELVSLAKNTVDSYVRSRTMPDYETGNPKFLSEGSTFVTIKQNGRLRGCIGNIEPAMPLYKSVMRNAAGASSTDPRFPPMKKEDLKDMEVEVSILSPISPLGNAKDIVIGKDGLLIVKDQKSGLLLPQVPVEFGWDRETFLRQVSLKAGLPEDAWKNGASLYRFGAEVIK